MKSLLFFLLLTGSTAFAQQATVDVSLSPAGSFKGKTSDVKGFALQKGNSFEAQDISVNLKSLKTGIELRDEHTQKYLETSKHPEAVLKIGTGSGGKGTGKILIKGIEKQISGTYTVSGNTLTAEFPLSLQDFKITGIRYMGVGVKDKVKVVVSVPIKK